MADVRGGFLFFVLCCHGNLFFIVVLEVLCMYRGLQLSVSAGTFYCTERIWDVHVMVFMVCNNCDFGDAINIFFFFVVHHCFS